MDNVMEHLPSSPLSLCFPKNVQDDQEQEKQALKNDFENLISTIPKYHDYYIYQGFHFSSYGLLSVMATQRQFQALPTDILLVTMPKSGTTWLKALAFATLNRHDHPFPLSCLHRFNPHDCVPFLEFQLYLDATNSMPDLSALPSPRLLAAHLPFNLLPPSVVGSRGCKIVYLCRNPKDMLVSLWHFLRDRSQHFTDLEVFFEDFLAGRHPAGPFWEHILGYWRASQLDPTKVLFMKFEELKKDPVAELTRLSKFMGCEFTKDEEQQGVVHELVEMCSFEEMKRLEVNQNGVTKLGAVVVNNKNFFRRGEVGDWVNYLTTEMVQKLDDITNEKFGGSGLSFTDSLCTS